jgi:hypothetical protein
MKTKLKFVIALATNLCDNIEIKLSMFLFKQGKEENHAFGFKTIFSHPLQ